MIDFYMFFDSNLQKILQNLMRTNKSTVVLPSYNLTNSLSIKQVASPVSRKVEGFDKTASSQTFNSKVDKLRTKPRVQGLEDQYITGLQDQIKYLEMELKLLQEKDQQRHGQIDQLQKFFGDGIPINENILAIKNGFNNYKHDHEKKIKELVTEKQQRTILINSLAQKVQQLLKELNEHQQSNRFSLQSNQKHWFDLIAQEASLKRGLEKEEQNLKTVKGQTRKLFEKIEKVTRNKLIDNITIIKQENNKHNKLKNLKETVAQREMELLELQKQYNDLQKSQEEKIYLMKLEEENLAQRKKIIALEREQDNLKIKIKERTIELQEKLKERMIEINSKMDIKMKVDDFKDEINKQNSMTVEIVGQMARAKEIERLKRIVDTNKKLAKYTDHYSNVLTNIQNSIETLAQRKPQAKSEIQAYGLDVNRLMAKQQAEHEREINLHAEMVQLEEQFNDGKAMITPLQERIRKSNEQIQSYHEEQRRLLDQIKIKQKQLELIFILKGLNFEEAEISKTSNRNIQQELAGFIKNWQKIQRIS